MCCVVLCGITLYGADVAFLARAGTARYIGILCLILCRLAGRRRPGRLRPSA
jgi:hypothetical protein